MNQVIQSFFHWFNDKKTVHEFLTDNGDSDLTEWDPNELAALLMLQAQGLYRPKRTSFRLKKAIDFHKNMMTRIGRQPRPTTNQMKNNNLIDQFGKFKSYGQM